eukprot:jgi/Orpsp1_1/1177744/evm.model.c7180000062658.1
MNVKILIVFQTVLTLIISSSLYLIMLRLNKIIDEKETRISNEDEVLEPGSIDNHYIVVLHNNATFIDEFSRTNWIKSAIDGKVENFSKVTHYYSIPSYAGWNTPSESLKILNEKGNSSDKVFKGFSARLSPELYEYFSNHPSVKFIENDIAVKVDDIVEEDAIDEVPNEDYVDTEGYVYYLSHCRWNLDRLENHDRTEDENYIYKFSYESASNVYIYILDTGVYDGHSSFTDRIGGDLSKNRVIMGKNFIDGEENTDLHGHGTHVAGIAGSTDFGVAKRANIVSVKVMNSKGVGKWSNIIAAFEWTINHLKTTGSNKGIINLSLSGNISQAAITAMKSTINQGMNIVAAAGNNGNDACNHTPGSSSSDGVVVVGNMDVEDYVATTSNYGKCVSVFAPGTKITSTSTINNDKRIMSGTSMASPHVAGVMALLLSIKDMTPKELYNEVINLASSGYLQDLDNESPNLIAFIPKSAYIFDRDTLPIPPSTLDEENMEDILIVQ